MASHWQVCSYFKTMSVYDLDFHLRLLHSISYHHPYLKDKVPSKYYVCHINIIIVIWYMEFSYSFCARPFLCSSSTRLVGKTYMHSFLNSETDPQGYKLLLPHQQAMVSFVRTLKRKHNVTTWAVWKQHCLERIGYSLMVLHCPPGNKKMHLIKVWCRKLPSLLAITSHQ